MKCKYHETDGFGNLLRRWTAAVVFVVVLLFGLAVAGCHRMLQSPEAYGMVSPVVKTYEKVSFDDGSWTANRVEKPFSVVSDEGLLSWDAAHYDEIRRYLYDTTSMWQGNFAFFPLFPLVWRLSHLGPVGISVLNWMLFAIGLVLVALIFGNSLPWWNCLLLLCAPYLVIFMVPYSEAVFFLGIAAGLYGLSHNRYWLYFLGFFLACTTRAAGNIIVVAWVIVDVLSAIYSRSGMLQLGRSLLRHLAPVVLGVLAVMLLQHIRGAEHWFEYVLAQREWGKEWAWPSWPFSDWSEEGKSVSQPLVYMLLVPSLVWLALKLWHALKPNTPPPDPRHYGANPSALCAFLCGQCLVGPFHTAGEPLLAGPVAHVHPLLLFPSARFRALAASPSLVLGARGGHPRGGIAMSAVFHARLYAGCMAGPAAGRDGFLWKHDAPLDAMDTAGHHLGHQYILDGLLV